MSKFNQFAAGRFVDDCARFAAFDAEAYNSIEWEAIKAMAWMAARAGAQVHVWNGGERITFAA